VPARPETEFGIRRYRSWDGSSEGNDVLELFHPATRAWFASAFAAPTAAQLEAWPAIKAGRHALVAAPTGSGKTLAAFLARSTRWCARASSMG